MTLTLPELAKKMQKIDFCMMLTRAEDGAIAGRPMSNNGDVEYDGDSYFFAMDDTRLFDDIDNVAVHVMRVETIDSDRHGFLAPIHLVQGLDDVLTRLCFVIRSDRIFQIKEDHIGIRLRCFFKHLRCTARHRKFAAIQACRGLGDDVKAHAVAFLIAGFAVRKRRKILYCQEK